MANSNVLVFPARPRLRTRDVVGRIVGLSGEARARGPNDGEWRAAAMGAPVRRETELITGLRTRLTVALSCGDLIQLKSVSCLSILDVSATPTSRTVRLAGRFGGMLLFPEGDRGRAFRLESFPAALAEAASKPLGNGEWALDPPARWRVVERATEIVIAGDNLEVRAVTLYHL